MDLDKRRMQLYILLGPAATNAIPEYYHPNPRQFCRDFDYSSLDFLKLIGEHIVNVIKKKGVERAAAETHFPVRIIRSMDPANKKRKALWQNTEPQPQKVPRLEEEP